MLGKRDRNDRPGSAEEETLLQRTEGIELTKQDLQEGYDTDLLNALPRGIAPDDRSALPASSPPSPTPSSTFPPASPAATHSFEAGSSKTSLEPPYSDAVELLPVKSAPTSSPRGSPRRAVAPATASPRNAAQVYAARARAAEFASDAKRKEGFGKEGGAQVVAGDLENAERNDGGEPMAWSDRARRRFKLSNLERRVWIWLAVVIFVCIAIGVGVGVGVGLGLKHRGGDEDTSGGQEQQDAPVRPTMVVADSPMRVPPEVTVLVTPDIQPSTTADDTYATPL